MNPIVCYFVLQLVGLYAMLLVLDYFKNPGSRYLESHRSPNADVLAYKKSAIAKDKAA